ncbi:MAG TPA: ABC transporter substrate-binding protein [Caldimonas sp.]|nr:ABC transporter substrate-binding protein [Caldimonas sp.]HEX2542654.1 ABC transporter substrate-binding protein [Caldimonas sp.]
MDRRRLLIAATPLLATASILRAQPTGRIARVGSVYVADIAFVRPFDDAFVGGLRESGYEVGRNLVYEVRHCAGDTSRIPAAVDELLTLKPDLLAGGEQVAALMKRKTSRIPIVLLVSSDPVGAGLAQSLARPGGNVTGIANLYDQLMGKQLEILHEIYPRMKRVAMLVDPQDASAMDSERHVREVARAMQVQVQTYPVADKAAIERAFADMARNPPDGLLAPPSPVIFSQRVFTVSESVRMRLPFAGGSWEGALMGTLFSYGSNLPASFRRAGQIAARILNGANPAEIPIEQPTSFELFINLKTAKAFGVRIPQALLARADRVIE